MIATTPSLTDTLCTRCGLCCDGSLFADVELSGPAEAARVEFMGLEVEGADGGDAGAVVLVQPCAALRGTRCSVYARRPACCRTFECRLLQDVRRGATGVEHARERIAEALRRIRRVKTLLARLGRRDDGLPLRERCADALASTPPAGARSMSAHAELASAVPALEKLLRVTFLGRGRV